MTHLWRGRAASAAPALSESKAIGPLTLWILKVGLIAFALERVLDYLAGIATGTRTSEVQPVAVA